MLQIIRNVHFAVLQMNHGKVNAMDLEFCDALNRELDALESSDIACLVFQSNTPRKIFSAGIDLKRILSEPPSYTRQYMPSMIRLFERIYFYTKPTLAVVEGVAIAGGCVMSAACSRRIGTPKAAFGMPNKKLDVPIPQLAPVILSSAAPPSVAKQLHEERLLSAEAARDCGFISEIVHESELPEAVQQQVNEISLASFQPRPRDEKQLQQFDFADQKMIDCWCTSELRERVSTYVKSIGTR